MILWPRRGRISTLRKSLLRSAGLAMTQALLELEQILRAKKLTLEEEKVLDACKSKAIRNFNVGALLGAGFGWIAPWRFSKFFRINVAGGAAVIFGFWRFDRSLTSCVDHILALDGTRMQRELKNIMITRLGNSPHSKQYLSKNFYLEKVFDDSTSDQPKLRWRHRNFYSDIVAFGRGTNDHDSDSNLRSSLDSENTIQSDIDSPRTDFDSNQTFMMPATDSTDPLDSIFGTMGGTEEIHHDPNASKTATKMHIHGRKISQRLRRMRQQKISKNSNTSPAAV